MGPSRSNSTITETTRVEAFTSTPQSRSTNIDNIIEDSSDTALPATIQWILDKLIAPCFIEDEPFSMFIRKVAILTYATMASAGWMLIVFFVVVAETTERPSDIDKYDSLRINMVCMGFYMMIWYVGLNYTYLRRTKTCPTWLADIASCGAILGMASFSIATLQADTRVLLMSTLLLTAMCSSPRFVLLALGHAAVYVFHYLRQNFRSEIPALQFPWDHDPVTVWEKVLVFVVLSIVPSLGAVIGMYVIVTNYIQRSQQAQVASRMTIEIAQQLERYDCEEVARVMSENRKAVEPRLYAALNAVRENLESYRPHIPQYLIDSAIERAQQQTDDELGIEGSFISDFSEGDIELSGNSQVVSPIEHDLQSESSCHQQQHHHHHHHQRLHSSSVHKPVHGQVTSLLLRLKGGKEFGRQDSAASLDVRQLNEAVEAINVLAKTYSASVHHIDGGVMFCTWNATKRLGNHEVRACNFAVHCMEKLKTMPRYSGSSISILSCQASAMFAGSTQMHFYLSHDHNERMRELLSLADKHGAIVCSPSVVRGGEFQFDFVAFNADSTGRLVYELVAAKETSVEGEWMYAIHGNSSCAHDDDDHSFSGSSSGSSPRSSSDEHALFIKLIKKNPLQAITDAVEHWSALQEAEKMSKNDHRNAATMLDADGKTMSSLHPTLKVALLSEHLPEGIKSRSTVSALKLAISGS